MLRGSVIVLLLFLTSLFSSTYASVVVGLELVQTETLPSIPVDYSIRITNSGLSPVQLPPYIMMTAETESGEKFNLYSFGSSGSGVFEIPDGDRFVGAGETKRFFFSTDVVPFSTFLHDPRLAVVGTYRLQVILTEHYESEESAKWSVAVSSPETLTVRLASDDDREVWKWMLEFSGDWSGLAWIDNCPAISDTIMAKYPRSNYYPYVVPCSNVPHSEKLALMEEVIVRFPKSSIRPRLQLFLADYHESNFKDWLQAGRRDEAVSELTQARKWAADAAGGASEYSRQHAREMLSKLPRPEDLPAALTNDANK